MNQRNKINRVRINLKKNRMMNCGLLMILFMTMTSSPLLAEEEVLPYFYPFVNPYEATVIPLPKAYKASLPEEIPSETFLLDIFPDRVIPEVFWYQEGLKCSLASQDHKAPMLFIIAGTGAEYKSPNMIDLQKTFYQAGFHVICLSSPTHMNFVVNACSGMPGNTPEDAKDLYRVMEKAAAYAREQNVDISGYALTGYSLGGIESAFVSKLDEERKVFNFDRVLLLNPPSNVVDSITILNDYLVNNVPGGMDNFSTWFRDSMKKVAADAKSIDEVKFTSESIYKLYRYYPPHEDFLKALIGLSFRLDSGNMVFTVDVMNGGGYILPKGTVLTPRTSLTGYAMTSYHTSFVDYFNEWFFPFYQKQEPGLTKQALIHRVSLNSIEDYLKTSKKIGLMHNEDDVIMAKGQVDYLAKIFTGRAKIFPTGGHCGNMSHPDAIAFMTDFLKAKEMKK